MFFEYPGLLWLLVIPALLVLHYIYLELSERHPHLRVSSSVPWMAGGKSLMAVIAGKLCLPGALKCSVTVAVEHRTAHICLRFPGAQEHQIAHGIPIQIAGQKFVVHRTEQLTGLSGGKAENGKGFLQLIADLTANHDLTAGTAVNIHRFWM